MNGCLLNLSTSYKDELAEELLIVQHLIWKNDLAIEATHIKDNSQ